MTIADVLLHVSDGGRDPLEEALRNQGVDPEMEVFLGSENRDDSLNLLEVKGSRIEEVTPLEDEGFRGVDPEVNPEEADEMRTSDTFAGLVVTISP